MQNQNDCVTLKKSIDEKSPVSTMVSLINRVSNPINFLFTKIENLWMDPPGWSKDPLLRIRIIESLGLFVSHDIRYFCENQDSGHLQSQITII